MITAFKVLITNNLPLFSSFIIHSDIFLILNQKRVSKKINKINKINK